MSDKRVTLDEAVAELRSGMTVGIGGWGSRRKPMAFVRAILRTDVKDLTVVTYGGPDLGLLCSAGRVKRVYYGFVSLDSPPFYDPWFAKTRTSGAIEAREMDEGMLRCGLHAADTDGHTATQLRDSFVQRHSLIAHGFFTNASRCSSDTPARLSSKVKPCSMR